MVASITRVASGIAITEIEEAFGVVVECPLNWLDYGNWY
jgi:hypothetical protein